MSNKTIVQFYTVNLRTTCADFNGMYSARNIAITPQYGAKYALLFRNIVQDNERNSAQYFNQANGAHF